MINRGRLLDRILASGNFSERNNAINGEYDLEYDREKLDEAEQLVMRATSTIIISAALPAELVFSAPAEGELECSMAEST